jgi:hypothetical protein
MTIIRETREFIQSKDKETRRFIFYIQANMHKRGIEREENIRRNAMSLFYIIMEISTFLSCRHFSFDIFLVDICICRHPRCRHFAFDILPVDIFFVDICICRHLSCRHFAFDILLSTFCLSTFRHLILAL